MTREGGIAHQIGPILRPDTATGAPLYFCSLYVPIGRDPRRYAVADHVVSRLKEHGYPWRLSEEAKLRREPPPN